jgi:hypothetical protein
LQTFSESFGRIRSAQIKPDKALHARKRAKEAEASYQSQT